MRAKYIAIALLFVLLLSGCEFMPVEETLPPVPVLRPSKQEEYTLTTVMRGDLVLEKKISCTFDLGRKESLSFSVGGVRIESVCVRIGQEVKKGDLLATLESKAVLEQIDAVQYQIDIELTNKHHLQDALQLKLDCYHAMMDTYSSDDEHMAQLQQLCDAAQEAYDKAVRPVEDSLYLLELQMQTLNESLDGCRLYAPIDGIVTYLAAKEAGQISKKGRDFVTISDPDSAIFYVNKKHTDLFPVGMQTTVVTMNDSFAVTVADPAQLTSVDPNPSRIYLIMDRLDPTLKSGDGGNITLQLDSREDVLYVDSDAIHIFEDNAFVYVPDENGLRVMKYVTTGFEADGMTEIVDGLAQGDQVIVE